MKVYLWLILLFFAAAQADANPCLQDKNLRLLDQQYEEALRVGNTKFLNELLADDFIWVHNLAVDIETKNQLLQRLQQNLEIVQTRSSTETTAHRLDKTVVLIGLSSVEKPYADDATVRVSRYRFLRTYVASGTQCQLLAVQTMKLTTSDGAND